jgi:ribosomal protein L37AE/L43A
MELIKMYETTETETYTMYHGNCPECNREQTSRYANGIDEMCFECRRNVKINNIIEVVPNANEILEYIPIESISLNESYDNRKITVDDCSLRIVVNDDTTLVIKYDAFDETYEIILMGTGHD